MEGVTGNHGFPYQEGSRESSFSGSSQEALTDRRLPALGFPKLKEVEKRDAFGIAWERQ